MEKGRVSFVKYVIKISIVGIRNSFAAALITNKLYYFLFWVEVRLSKIINNVKGLTLQYDRFKTSKDIVRWLNVCTFHHNNGQWKNKIIYHWRWKIK